MTSIKTIAEPWGVKPKVIMDPAWDAMKKKQRENEPKIWYENIVLRGDRGVVYLTSLKGPRYGLYTTSTKGARSLFKSLQETKSNPALQEMDGEAILMFDFSPLVKSLVLKSFPFIKAERTVSKTTSKARSANMKKVRKVAKTKKVF